jgi:hypothetical protein
MNLHFVKIGRCDAVLGEEVGGSGDSVSIGIGDIIKMAMVAVLGRAEEPSVKTVRCPGCARIGIFIDDRFCAGRSHWVLIPIVRAFEHLVGRFVRMHT